MEIVPGRIPDYLVDDSIGLLRADDRVIEAMLDGWRAQQLARGLTTAHIKTSSRIVTRFQEHTNEYPWTWLAHHFEEFLADLRTGEPPLKVSTLRSYTTAIRAFTRYVSDTRYGWVVFCERVFNDIPAQIVFDWNSPRHSTDDDVPTGRRALTRHELQSLFDAADGKVTTKLRRAVLTHGHPGGLRQAARGRQKVHTPRGQFSPRSTVGRSKHPRCARCAPTWARSNVNSGRDEGKQA